MLQMMILIQISLVAKKSLIALLMNLLEAMKLRNLLNTLKGGCGSSQNMMIVAQLVLSLTIRMM